MNACSQRPPLSLFLRCLSIYIAEQDSRQSHRSDTPTIPTPFLLSLANHLDPVLLAHQHLCRVLLRPIEKRAGSRHSRSGRERHSAFHRRRRRSTAIANRRKVFGSSVVCFESPCRTSSGFSLFGNEGHLVTARIHACTG